MWERLRSVWTVPDLRNKILFTLGMLLIFRVLAHITVPLTSAEQQNLLKLFSGGGNQNLGQLLGLLDVFSGGSLQTFSIVALGVYPYITATIVMQLLQPIIPALQNLSVQDQRGRLLDHRTDNGHRYCLHLPGATAYSRAVPDKAYGGAWHAGWFCSNHVHSYAGKQCRYDPAHLRTVYPDLSGGTLTVPGIE